MSTHNSKSQLQPFICTSVSHLFYSHLLNSTIQISISHMCSHQKSQDDYRMQNGQNTLYTSNSPCVFVAKLLLSSSSKRKFTQQHNLPRNKTCLSFLNFSEKIFCPNFLAKIPLNAFKCIMKRSVKGIMNRPFLVSNNTLMDKRRYSQQLAG